MSMIAEFLSSIGITWTSSFVAGDVLATLAVGFGIWLERARNPTRTQRIAIRFVIIGVIAETLCSIGLFAYDEAISQSQQREIIRLSPRDISPKQRQAIGEACKQFGGQHLGISSITGDAEGVRLGMEIMTALKPKGFTFQNELGGTMLGDVRFGVHITSPITMKPLASCLIHALRNGGGLVVEEESNKRRNSPFVVIWIDLKPLSID